MAKRVAKGLSEMKKNLKTMGESIESLDLNNTIKRIKFENIQSIDKKDIGKIMNLIRKYNGVVYGTSIASSINNKKAPVRKTSDLDVKFHSRHDQKSFAEEVVKMLGPQYKIVKGYFGESIRRKKNNEVIIDTAVIPKGYNHHKNKIYDVTLDSETKYIDMHTKHPKVVTYKKGINGESYSTSSQRKIHAAISDASMSRTLTDQRLRADKERRSGKDFFDVRTYSADGYIRAMEQYAKETDPTKKRKLNRLINKYGRAILRFSADKNVIELRTKAEQKYIKDGMLKQRHFTSNERMRMERNLYEKLKKNPKLDLTKEGTKWIESMPLNKKANGIRIDAGRMF